MKEQVVLKNINDFENKSLLIVDDDNPFRERLARAMEKKGFEVIQAESVQKGVESVKAKKPGFAVVDLKTWRWQRTRGCKTNSKYKS